MRLIESVPVVASRAAPAAVDPLTGEELAGAEWTPLAPVQAQPYWGADGGGEQSSAAGRGESGRGIELGGEGYLVVRHPSPLIVGDRVDRVGGAPGPWFVESVDPFGVRRGVYQYARVQLRADQSRRPGDG